MSTEPGLSQVVTYAADGTSQPRYLGQLGHVAKLSWGFTLPGGPDQMTCTLQQEASFRTDAMNPGRIAQVIRGGQAMWEGRLDEPAPAADGWTITAHGAGTYGTDYLAAYSSWTNKNDAVNQAIARGLRWVNPGSGITAGVYLGQKPDPGSLSITDLLNQYCTKGTLSWQVRVTPAGNALSVFALPATVDRLLVAPGPVPRTLAGFVNTIYLRYQSSADGAKVATYGLTSVSNAASASKHGTTEAFIDVSSAGLMTAGAAQALGSAVLARYTAVTYAGPFTARYGELMTTGGTPVDLGMERAGHVCQLILTDFGYGGEVKPDPVTFLVGGYSWDDQAEVATITPFQSVDSTMSGLLSAVGSTLRHRSSRAWPGGRAGLGRLGGA